MKRKIIHAFIEMLFIIFLFYSNLFMGEYERSGAHKASFLFALEDIFTFSNFTIALISSFIAYIVFEYLRKKF